MVHIMYSSCSSLRWVVVEHWKPSVCVADQSYATQLALASHAFRAAASVLYAPDA